MMFTRETLLEEVRSRVDARLLANRAMSVYGVNVFEKTRRYEVVRARHMIMWLLRERGYSMPVIARALGLANHTSVFHGLNRVMERGLVEEAARMDQQTTDQAAWTSKNYAPTSTG